MSEQASETPRRLRFLYGFLVSLATAYVGFLVWSFDGSFLIDDAYINLHNAKVLLEGSDPNFPGVNPLHGSTSLVFLALLTGLGGVIGLVPACWMLVWGGLVLLLTGVARSALAAGCRAEEAFLLALGVGVSGGAIWQYTNGMETSIAVAAVAWTLALLDEKRFDFPLAALCGVMPFVRPELSVLSAISLLILIARGPSPRSRYLACAIATLSALPFAAWLLGTAGTLLPATADAKRFWFAEEAWPLSRKVDFAWEAVWAFLLNLGVLGSGLAFLVRRGVALAALAFGLGMLVLYVWKLPGALFHNNHRYLYALVPCAAYGLAAAIASPSKLGRLSGMGIIIVAVLWGSGLLTRRWQSVVLVSDRTIEQSRFRSLIPPDAKILVHNVGYIAWITDVELVDLVGLKSPKSIDVHRRLTWPTSGARRGEAILEIARHEQPTHLIVTDGWEGIFLFTATLEQAGWKLDKLFDGYNDLYKLTPPNR